MKSHEKQSSKVTEVWIAALFKKFNGLYLNKWATCIEGIEEAAIQEWTLALDGLTGDQIKTGLSRLDSDWPPSAYGFKSLCVDSVPIYHKLFPPPAIESDEMKANRKKSARKAVSQIRKILS